MTAHASIRAESAAGSHTAEAGALIARYAISELHQRKASIDAAVNAGRFPRAQGERNLRLWLSIALVAGAGAGECGAVVGLWQEDNGLSDCTARAILLAGGPPSHEYLAELARARNLSAARLRASPSDANLIGRYAVLESLAITLGAPGESESAPHPTESND